MELASHLEAISWSGVRSPFRSNGDRFYMWTIILLVSSNIFMTLARYGQNL
jgi:hypothetical protein